MYKFSKLIKEASVEEGSSRNVWVALVQSERESQPFRLLIENFETEEDVMKEVNAWIAARSQEDESAELERERLAKEATQEDVASKLNNSI